MPATFLQDAQKGKFSARWASLGPTQNNKDSEEGDADVVPEGEDVLMEGVFRYLPGIQKRRIVLTSQKLALAIENEQEMLDCIPVHEITDVVRGDEDLQLRHHTLFDEWDSNHSGNLSAYKVEHGLEQYGVTHMQTHDIFFSEHADTEDDEPLFLTRTQFERGLDQAIALASATIIIHTLQDGNVSLRPCCLPAIAPLCF